MSGVSEELLGPLYDKEFPNQENKFYYQGKYFKTESEFWDYVKKYEDSQTNDEDFNVLFDMVKKDLWLNIKMRKIKITNGQLRSILEEVFMSALEQFFKIEQYEKI